MSAEPELSTEASVKSNPTPKQSSIDIVDIMMGLVTIHNTTERMWHSPSHDAIRRENRSRIHTLLIQSEVPAYLTATLRSLRVDHIERVAEFWESSLYYKAVDKDE